MVNKNGKISVKRVAFKLKPSHNDQRNSINVNKLNIPIAMNRKLSGTKLIPINPNESKADVNMNRFLLLINYFSLLRTCQLFLEEYLNL